MKKMKILIFSGGTGSAMLKKGFNELLTNYEIYSWINLGDSGKSTGIVAEICQSLGVSDVRKNLSLYYYLEHKDAFDENIMSFLEGRYFLGKNIEEARTSSKKYIKKFLNLPKFLELVDDFFDLAKKRGYQGIFEDFNLANIVMGISFSQIGIDRTIAMMKEILKIKNCNIIVPWHNYNKLYGKTKSGFILDNEAKIVDWANPDDKINEVYFVDKDTGKISYEYDLFDQNYLNFINESDIIILSTGTQWSSLIPSYMNRKVKEALEKNWHKVIVCMNNKQDKDMYGVNHEEMLKIISKYLDISKLKILYNKDADETMKPQKAKYMFAFGNDEKGRSDPKLFAEAILKTHYNLIDRKNKYLFDFDNTIFARDVKDLSVSRENLKLLELIKEKVVIISGNTKEHIIAKLDHFINEFVLYTNMGLIKNTIYGHEYFDKNYYLTKKDVEKISKIIDLKDQKIRGDKNVITSIAYSNLQYDRQEILKKINEKLGYDLNAVSTGSSTIEITKKGASKLLAFNNEIKDIESFAYFGDEINGNDQKLYQKHKKNFIVVNNPYEMNVILKIITKQHEKKYDVLILSGGKQTRFQSDYPKLLAQYEDTTILERNINVLKSINVIDNIYVAENETKAHFYKNIKDIKIIELNDQAGCGKGCGDGLYHALLKMKKNHNQNIILCWSDIILDKENISHAIKMFKPEYINVPVVIEEKPYVGFVSENNIIKKVLFSKKGDDTSQTDLHDLSFFIGSYDLYLKYCLKYEQEYMVNNQFDFLDIFNVFKNIGYSVIIKDSLAMSFNSIYELDKLKERKIKNAMK